MKYMSFIVIFMLEVLPCTFQLNIETRHQEISDSDQKINRNERKDVDNNVFPKDFLFGVSTSAPQYEGAWNESGRGESVLDHMTHANPGVTDDGTNMEVANDFYHKYKEDIRLARSIGSQVFRTSFSWTRILPNGFVNHVNEDGVQFYNNLLDEIMANDMIPMVMLFQWDLPYNMQKMGGLSNPLFVDWFEQYARFVFATFGHKVKYWLTIFEPNILCYSGYGDLLILPGLNISGIADYLCGHHTLLAHARVYHLYDREFRASQNGKIGYTLELRSYEPKNPLSQEDVIAAENSHQWGNSWLLDPVFSKTGDYPRVMKERIARKSFAQGFSESRLPTFTEEQIRYIRGSADFLGANYYTHTLVKSLNWSEVSHNDVSYINDAEMIQDEFHILDLPSSFEKILRRLNEEYHQPTIFITANAFESIDLNDVTKVHYLQGHLAEILKAIRNGINIRGYLHHTLLDDLEFNFGLTRRFGLFHVDFNDSNLTRTPRLSLKYINGVYKTRRLEEMFNEI